MENNEEVDKQEMLDEIDENEKTTGASYNRKYVHENGVLHGGSHTFIYKIDENGKVLILLQRRSENKDSFPGCLDISSAGHVEHRMGFIDTAVKELNEELGIKVTEDELQLAFKQRYSNIDEFHGKTFNNQEINYVYAMKKDIDEQELTLQKEEVSEVLWMDADEIMERLQKGDKEVCIDLKELKKIIDYIKKKENIREDGIMELKDVYDDAIFEGEVKGAYATRRAGRQRRSDGSTCLVSEMVNGDFALSMARERDRGCDPVIAKAVVYALQDSVIAYGKVGEKFLRGKLEKSGIEFSQKKYTMYIAEQIVSGYRNEKRKKKFMETVESALENDPNCVEANAAKLAIIYNEMYTRGKVKVPKALRKSFDEGGVIMVEDVYKLEEDLRRGENMTGDPTPELEMVYSFVMKHYDDINPDFKASFPDLSREELVAYYIANSDEPTIRNMYMKALKENSNTRV